MAIRFKSSRRRPAPKRRLTRKVVSTIAKRVVNRGSELKRHDVLTNVSNVSTTGLIQDMSAVAQGSTDVTRVGDSLSPRFLQIRYQLAAGDTTNAVRVIYFHWKPNSTPLIDDVLEVETSPFSAYSNDNKQEFKIVYDRLHSVSTSGPDGPVVVRKIFGLMSKIQYFAAGTTGSQKIWRILLSDSGAAAHPTFVGHTRLQYYDR